MNTKRLKIRLWMMFLLLIGALYVLGVLITDNGSQYAAIGLTAGFCLGLIVLIASGWAGLASYRAHQKEANRGTSDHHRP